VKKRVYLEGKGERGRNAVFATEKKGHLSVMRKEKHSAYSRQKKEGEKNWLLLKREYSGFREERKKHGCAEKKKGVCPDKY